MRNVADWLVQTADYGMYTHKSTFWQICEDGNLYIYAEDRYVAVYQNWLFIRKKEEAK